MNRKMLSLALILVFVGLWIAGCGNATTPTPTATIPAPASTTRPFVTSSSLPSSTPKRIAIPTEVETPTCTPSYPPIAPWLTDPKAIATEDGPYLILRKELYGYENYGTADGKADVVYSCGRGTWNFSLTDMAAGTPRQVVIKGVLDDHYDVALDSYNIRVTVNGVEVFSGFPTGFQHGAPFGGEFSNWTTLSVVAAGGSSITIQNTSPISSVHWIAFDWIELHVSRQDLVIEHADCTLGWTRLTAGGQASVSEDSILPNRVRSEPSAAASITALLYPGTVVKVLEGPNCAEGLVFWKVVSELIPGGVGWTAEGDGTEYYWVPYPP